MASTMTLTENDEFDYKSRFKEESVDSTRSISNFPCCPWTNHAPRESIRSSLDSFGLESFRKNLLLKTITSHCAGAFIVLKEFGPTSSFSAELEVYEKLSNDRLASGTIFLRKTTVDKNSDITEIRISWEERKPDREPEIDGLLKLDGLGYYNDLDSCAKLSEPIQSMGFYYQLMLETYTGPEDDISHSAQHNSIWSEIRGDLYHHNGETETHWSICSSGSRSWGYHSIAERDDCVDISVSYIYGLSTIETFRCVTIRINACTEAVIQLSLQNNVERKAKQGDPDPHTSIFYQRSCLKVDFLCINKKGVIKHKNTTNQPKPNRMAAAMNMREASAAPKDPETSRCPFRNNLLKRRKDSEELESEQLAEKPESSDGTARKRITPDDTGGLACPFYKRDPWRFDRCLTYKMSKISYVKQHLLRYHDTLECDRPTCQNPLINTTEQDSHTDCQKGQCTLYGMTAKQKRDIQKAAGRKITCEVKWYQIWAILFPGARKPDSPFVKSHYFAEVLSSIQAFYHDDSKPHVLEDAFRHVLKDGRTYQEAFDGLLRRIEHRVLTQALGLGSSSRSVGADGADWLVSCRSPSTNNDEEPFSFSPMPGEHNANPIVSPSAIRGDEEKALAMDDESGILSYDTELQICPFIWDGADASERHKMLMRSPDPSQFVQIDGPSSYQDTSSLDCESQDAVIYHDNTMNCHMAAMFEHSYFTSSPTSADYGVGAGISDWIIE
ncbi:hypothetical protein F5B22DRAFT_5246 [Xylaria bambusicola]|uniref:uncharacterized protein n=1 Tax=Xylaria bambusicola TaxID=326684 RepID=UPI0020085EB9|nr:uncharacterized protein F5B22DRAFT_5246 [Xylaria bambusicola]KAI0527817.1 hypothetical protein F5B22DRAFT_5246 [Xylaria bambusicola]